MEHDEFNPETQEENVYSNEGREEYLDGGEITPEEEAFMQGYDEADEEESDDFEDEDEDDDNF